MGHPVDLSNLREMIDGDVELEKALFEEFYLAGEQCIAALQASLTSGDAQAWRASAHALKGTALNLGANDLGALCKQAQDEYEFPTAQRAALLLEIQTAFEISKDYLRTL